MNRRNQDIVSDEALIAHLVKNYTYDATRGVVVNRKLNRVVKGSMNSVGYVRTCLRIEGQKTTIKLHHMVWAVVHGRFPTQIDHINGDKTDNRLCNLREVTGTENNMNRVWAWKPNARTGLPGVFPDSDLGYRMEIFGKSYYFHNKYETFHCITLLGRMYE